MKYCKHCGHEIRRQKGVFKHRMIVQSGHTLKGYLAIFCSNLKKHTFKTCRCIKPEPKRSTPQMRERKLKVYGTTHSCLPEHKHLLDPERHWRTQVRYVAAVFSRKEFAELLHTPIGQIQNYSATTSNKKEIELAMAKPHTLIFIEVR